jgi:large subunit ribosomal protein L27e
MGKNKIQKRTCVKPFVKYVNFNHMMPTRYQVSGEIDFKNLVTEEKANTQVKI